jgi:DNA-binding MarR family transcriptional regulator
MISYETTHHVRDHCLCLHAQRTARTLARRFDEALRPLDLTNGQFSLLISLNRPKPAAMTPVAVLLGMDRTTLTAALKPLQRRGLVETVADADDKRSRLLKLTRAGHALLNRAVPVWERTHAEIDRALAGQDPDKLRSALRSLA